MDIAEECKAESFARKTEKKKTSNALPASTRALKSAREFLNSRVFYAFEVLLACFFVAIRQEVVGAICFLALLSVILAVCDDIRATTLPFLIICTITTNRYNSYNLYIKYIIFAPAVLMALAFHFVVYHKSFSLGESAKGIFAVGIAVCFGGLGRFSLTDYAYGAYYFIGLGFGMMLVYALMRSEFYDDKETDREKFAYMMTIYGLLCGFMIANGYYKLYIEKSIQYLYPQGFSRNNLSTLLMFVMPFPLYLARKKSVYALLSVMVLAFLALTQSRGGFLFGCVEFAACAVFWICSAKNKKGRKVRLIVCVGALAIGVCVMLPALIKWILPRFNGEMKNETRYKMIWEAFDKFFKRPVSGYGLLDTDILYETERKKGALTWYHMMPAQIIGGMGLIGVACYGYQLFNRAKLVFSKPDSWGYVLGLSYLGVLLMSMVNPGEFCPLPFELLAVLLFIMQERRLQTSRPLYKDKLRRGV